MMDYEIKKFKSLQGRAREVALEKYRGIKENDLVIVSTRFNPLPIYEVEKIDGDPLKYLFNLDQRKPSELKG